ELAVMKGTLERFVEFAAKDSAEHLDGKKEIVAWFDPVGVIGRQPTGRHHAMYMRVKFEVLSPAVQHAEEADFCTSCRRWHDVRSGCIHRDGRRARRYDTAQWPGAL